MRKFLIIVSIILILAIIANNYDEIRVILKPKTGTFDELVLSKITDANFRMLDVYSSKSVDRFRPTKEKHIIDEALSLFKDLELKEVNSVPEFKDYYRFDFGLSKTHENIWISVFDKNHIEVSCDVYTVEVKGNITYKTTEPTKRVYYKIETGEIDLETIEKIFNQMEPNK